LFARSCCDFEYNCIFLEVKALKIKRSFNYRKIIASLFCCLECGAALVSFPTIAFSKTDNIQTNISHWLDAPKLRNSVAGVEIQDVRTKRVVYSANPNTLLMPASCRKLFTAAFALQTLGAGFQTHTLLLADSAPDNGILKGSLYIKGRGDALLSASDIAEMAAKLNAMGVKRITGDIVCDDSVFTDDPYSQGWQWDYLSEDYAPQISSLEVEEGVISAYATGASAVGQKPVIKLTPASAYVPVENRATTGAAGTPITLKISRPYDKSYILVTGSIPVDYNMPKPVRVTVQDPALYATTLLVEDLLSSGVAIDGVSKRGVAPENAVPIANHESLPLKDYIALMLKSSDNLMAETLYRLVAAQKGASGSYHDGYQIEQQFLDKIGLTSADYLFVDGSGLSRENLVSANAVVKLLTYMALQPDFRYYFDALSIGGVDGTLQHRFEFAPLKGNVHGKTGTLRNAHTLCGYVSDSDNNIIAFAILNNNFACDSTDVSRVQDAVVGLVARDHAIGFVPIKTRPLISPLLPATPKLLRRPVNKEKESLKALPLLPAESAPRASSLIN